MNLRALNADQVESHSVEHSGGQWRLALPYPPSVNQRYRRNANGGQRLSKEENQYRMDVLALSRVQCPRLVRQGPFPWPVGLRIVLHPPALKRTRDGDNPIVPLFNALKGVVVQDDSMQWIPFYSVEAGKPAGQGSVEIQISRWGR